VDLVNFGGGAALGQALASDSIDVAAASLQTVVQLIAAGHRVKAFYVAISRPDHEWFARPGLSTWAEIRGGSVAVTAPGGLTDVLTRHVLRRQGLEPGRDVMIVAGGGSAARLGALRAGRVDAAILHSPFRWHAQAQGLARLSSHQAIAAEWPDAVLAAKEHLLDKEASRLRRLLAAHVRGLRIAKADRPATLRLLEARLRLGPEDAERAYEELVLTLGEGGALPARDMPVFWEVLRAAGEVTEPWPEPRVFDRRFVDSFAEWAPR
jgi:NitT/TauT family transport system substrate-binding protein